MLAPNSVLQGRYRIIEIIGQGGMGAVYKAIDERLRSTVALKQTFLSDDREMARAFEREAQLLGNLSHPALPRVTDHFVEAGGQFLIMEFIPGDDLARQLKLQRQPFSHELVLEWGYQILDVLQYLHEHQPPIIHRDIKPQNLKLNDRGRIILLDFGLAKGAPQLADPDASSIFGYTLNYAPLEQIQHSGSEQRSDLFSLAATLYHLMTATLPLGSVTRASAIVNGQPDPLISPSALEPSVPPSIARAIMHTMSLRLEDRPVGARAMRKTFDEAAQRESIAESADYSSAADYPGARAGAPAVFPANRVFVDDAGPATRLMGSPDHLSILKPDIDVQTTERGRRPRISAVFRPLGIILSCATAVVVANTLMTRPFPGDQPESRRPAGRRAERPGPPLVPPALRPDFPQLNATDALTVSRDGNVKIRWQPTRGAVEYRIETCASDFSGVRFAASTTKTTHSIKPSHDYAFIRLVAVSDTGIEARSRWQTVWSEYPNLILPSTQPTDSKGITRLRWVPVLRTVRYTIEIADEHLDRILEASSANAEYNIRIPAEAGFIRVIAIDKRGETKVGGWTPSGSIVSPAADR